MIEAEDMREILQQDRVLGLGEFMNYPGVIAGVDRVLDKLIAAEGKLVDGHCPNLEGKELNAYAAAGIHTDHECSTVKEMEERLRLGMYVLLRQGSACHIAGRVLSAGHRYVSPFWSLSSGLQYDLFDLPWRCTGDGGGISAISADLLAGRSVWESSFCGHGFSDRRICSVCRSIGSHFCSDGGCFVFSDP